MLLERGPTVYVCPAIKEHRGDNSHFQNNINRELHQILYSNIFRFCFCFFSK